MIKVIFFTDKGRTLAERLPGERQLIDGRMGRTEENVREAFERRIPLVFVGATGIAVRIISPYIADKTRDPAVLCMDEKGDYVIPLLSGHIGGANELARQLASETGGVAVITTATDVSGSFAVDVFAQKNGLLILNPSAIKLVSAKILRGEKATIKSETLSRLYAREVKEYLTPVWGQERADIVIQKRESLSALLVSAGIDPYLPLPPRREREERLVMAGLGQGSLYLFEKNLCVGIGCRRGTGFEEIFSFLSDILSHKGLPMAAIDSVSSIDIKAEEKGLLDLCGALGVSFSVYSAEELRAAKGCFKPSAYVESVVGVDNVCERAAAISAGEGAKKLVGKVKTERVTISIYEKVH